MYTNYKDKLEAMLIRGAKPVQIRTRKSLEFKHFINNINIQVVANYNPSAN